MPWSPWHLQYSCHPQQCCKLLPEGTSLWDILSSSWHPVSLEQGDMSSTGSSQAHSADQHTGRTSLWSSAGPWHQVPPQQPWADTALTQKSLFPLKYYHQTEARAGITCASAGWHGTSHQQQWDTLRSDLLCPGHWLYQGKSLIGLIAWWYPMAPSAVTITLEPTAMSHHQPRGSTAPGYSTEAKNPSKQWPALPKIGCFGCKPDMHFYKQDLFPKEQT